MDEVSGVVQSPSTIDQFQQVPRQEQQGESAPVDGGTNGVVTDTVTLSQEGLQRSQTVGQAEAANEDTNAADAQQQGVSNDQNTGAPAFLDIRI